MPTCQIFVVSEYSGGHYDAPSYSYGCRNHGVRWDLAAPHTDGRCPLGKLEDRVAALEQRCTLEHEG